MADEQVMTGSAGPAQRQRRPRRGPAAAREGVTRPDLDRRERNISERRKPMGPRVPPEGGAGLRPEDERTRMSDEPPTDPD
jgi:hypothetical protein